MDSGSNCTWISREIYGILWSVPSSTSSGKPFGVYLLRRNLQFSKETLNTFSWFLNLFIFISMVSDFFADSIRNINCSYMNKKHSTHRSQGFSNMCSCNLFNIVYPLQSTFCTSVFQCSVTSTLFSVDLVLRFIKNVYLRVFVR